MSEELREQYSNDSDEESFAAIIAWAGYALFGRGIVTVSKFPGKGAGFGYIPQERIKEQDLKRSLKRKIAKAVKRYNPEFEYVRLGNDDVWFEITVNMPMWEVFDQIVQRCLTNGVFDDIQAGINPAMITPVQYLRFDHDNGELIPDLVIMPTLGLSSEYSGVWADIRCRNRDKAIVVYRELGIPICFCKPDKLPEAVNILSSSNVPIDDSDISRERLREILETMKDDGIVTGFDGDMSMLGDILAEDE